MKIKPFILAAIVVFAALCVILMLSAPGEENPRVQTVQMTMASEPTQASEPEESTEPISTEPITTEPTSAELTTQEPASETQEPTFEEVTQTEPTTQPLTLPPTEETVDEELLAQIDELIASVYELQAYYTAQLAAIEESAVNRYHALPDAERTEEAKSQIALEASDAAYALEKECNIKIDTICAELGFLLTCAEMPLQLVSEVRYAYAYEKERVKNTLSGRYGELFG